MVADSNEPRSQCYFSSPKMTSEVLPCKKPEAFALEPKEPHGDEYKFHRDEVNDSLYVPPDIGEHDLHTATCTRGHTSFLTATFQIKAMRAGISLKMMTSQ